MIERKRIQKELSRAKDELANLRDLEGRCYNTLRELNENYQDVVSKIHLLQAQLRE